MNLPITEGAVEAYERLRPHLLELSDQNGSNPDRVILLRRGMLTWACERNHLMASSSAPVSNPISPAVRSPSCGELGTELVRLMASLILSSPKERYYAGTESHQLPSGA
jgi:hypothetical protein